jgi:probable rRNA maturation factor
LIDVRFEKRLPAGKAGAGVTAVWVRRIIAKTLKAERSNKTIGVLVTGDRQIRRLNRRFLKHDYATDVISFETGDVVVSVDTARRVSRELGIPAKEELARYLVHGTLHLLGYDDKKREDLKKMRARQEKILKTL